jgi:hypothetical protein
MLSKILNYFSSLFLYKSQFYIYIYLTKLKLLNLNENILLSSLFSKNSNVSLNLNMIKQIFYYSEAKKCGHHMRRITKISSIIKKFNLYKWSLYNKQRYNFSYKNKVGFIDIYKLLNFETFHMTLKPWLNMYSFYISFVNFGLFGASFNYSISNFYFLSLFLYLI